MERTQPATQSPQRQNAGPHWLQVLVIGRNPRFTFVRILVLVVVCLLVFNRYVLVPIHIEGPSMLPTYQNNGVNFVNRLAYVRHDPQRHDVVAIRFAGPSIMLMKRVIGLPGETVSFLNGQVFINGEPLPEPYVKLPSNWNRPPQTLAPDEYFVVGDNRSMPLLLHEHGAVKRGRIVGKVLL